jgi:hypothetical protein
LPGIETLVEETAAGATSTFQSEIDAGDATVEVITEATFEIEEVEPVKDPLDPPSSTETPTTTSTPSLGSTTAVEDCTNDQFSNTIVDCDGGHLAVAVPMCAIIKGGFDPSAVYMGADTCAGTIDEVRNVLVFEADADGCEAVVPVVNDTHIYFESTIMTSGGGFSNSVISRRFGLEMDFTCAIEREITVSIENGIDVSVNHFIVDLGAIVGTFEASMGVFVDDSFSNPVPVNHTFNIPDPVFIGIELENSETRSVSLDTCTAYIESDLSRASGYDLIASGCAVDPATDILQVNQGQFGKNKAKKSIY